MFALADCPAETRAYLHGSIQKSSGPCRVRMDPCLLYANAQVRVCFARSLGVWLVRGLDCITVAEEAIGKSPGALHEFASDLLAFLFMLLSDESREVAARAVSELNAVGIHWQLATSKSISKWCVAELPLPCVPSVLPRDFACNAAYLVSSAATTLVTLHFQPILNIQLAWLSCWMPPMRLKQCACHMFHLGIVPKPNLQGLIIFTLSHH
jgi:hypothetical protein